MSPPAILWEANLLLIPTMYLSPGLPPWYFSLSSKLAQIYSFCSTNLKCPLDLNTKITVPSRVDIANAMALKCIHILNARKQISYPCLPLTNQGALYSRCVFIPSPVREGSTFLVITGVQFFQTELKPVRMVSAEANLKIFQHKVVKPSFLDLFNCNLYCFNHCLYCWIAGYPHHQIYYASCLILA